MPPFASLAPARTSSGARRLPCGRCNSAASTVTPAAGDAAAGEALLLRATGGAPRATSRPAARRGGGPDLSNVGRRLTQPELTQALTEPGAAIAQGTRTARAQLNDGRTLRGFVRNEGNHVLPLQTVDGRLMAVTSARAVITRETGSVMPPLKATRGGAAEPDRVPRDGWRRRDATAGRAQQRAEAAAATNHATQISTRFCTRDLATGRPITAGSTATGTARTRKSPRNVPRLSLQWIHSLRGFDNEMTPLVLDGIMYVTGTTRCRRSMPRSGREIWRFSRPRTPGLRGDAAHGFNRGVAVVGPRVFLVTDNAHLMA